MASIVPIIRGSTIIQTIVVFYNQWTYYTNFLSITVQDASAKLPSGSLLANIHWLGMYGECLEISSKQSQTEKLDSSTVLGKYCLVSIGDDTTAEDILVGNVLNN